MSDWAADAANELAVLISQVNEMLAPIGEAATGYREDMKRQGFNDAAANLMAVRYHGILMDVIKAKIMAGMK